METPVTNSPREIRLSENSEKSFGLDQNIAFLISRTLANKDLFNLCQSSKGFRGIFYPSLERRLIILFLGYVIAGRLDKVGEILNKHPKLALAHGDITDLSGRYFKNITGFQYAIWSGDVELWELILKYLPENKAYDQLIALTKERSDITKTHGDPLSFFEPLLAAYERYLDFYSQSKWDQCAICWNKEVGGAQRNMPAWFIYMFSEEGKDKAWPTKQMTRGFTREIDHIKTWFEQEYNNGKCGSTFAFYRAMCSRAERVGYVIALQVMRVSDPNNSATLKILCTKKLAVLTERLSRASKKVSNASLIMNRK